MCPLTGNIMNEKNVWPTNIILTIEFKFSDRILFSLPHIFLYIYINIFFYINKTKINSSSSLYKMTIFKKFVRYVLIITILQESKM